jgi:hypothetical protein
MGDCVAIRDHGPTLIISVRLGESRKQVVHDLRCRGFSNEQSLTELEDELYKLVERNNWDTTLNWIRIVPH